jgi:hypothetical protein
MLADPAFAYERIAKNLGLTKQRIGQLAKDFGVDELCVAYRRSRQNPAFRIRAEDVRNELAIPENVFVEALDSFIDANGKRIVEVFEQNGERYLSLGDLEKQ